MVRLIALFNRPDGPDAFDAHYRDVHLPMVRRYPKLHAVRVFKLDSVGPRQSAFYLMTEMVFESREDLDAAIASEAGRESARDLRNFATAGVELFVATDGPDPFDG